VVRGTSPVLASTRARAFAALAVVVVAWFVAAPHIPSPGHAWNVVLVSFVVLPATLLLVLVALPLWDRRRLWIAAIVFIALAIVFRLLELGLPANFSRLAAAVCLGWAFLALFEQLSWVVLVALIVPFVDIISVWRGPTHTITTKHFAVYENVAIAFIVPGGSAAYLGPPDVLFYALFLGAAARWQLRVVWTWIACTGIYSLTIVIANIADVGGLPALPFLSFGFLLANGDLLWRRLRRPSPSAGS
jgi:hypothetical protein